MQFDKFKAEIKSLEIDTVRSDTENYLEAVVKKTSLDELLRILENNFGPAAWPSREKLPKETQKIADGFGGLRKGQTLYFLKGEGHSIFAMLWPWQDNEHITIKAGKV